MKLSRREMLLAGLGFLVTGCTTGSTPSVHRPTTQWPTPVDRPSVARSVPVLPPEPAAAPGPAAVASGVNPLHAIARARWAHRGPVPGRVNPMGSISRITVHHEGWTPVTFTDQTSTAARIEHDRNIHVRDRGWGDIGYHFIIDRAGRVWQGRDLRYQGAHVSGHNEQNIGIMCLGNFDQQHPSSAQVASLASALRTLMQTYRVPVRRVYTHQEFSPTACPGRYLQPRVAALRNSGQLA